MLDMYVGSHGITLQSSLRKLFLGVEDMFNIPLGVDTSIDARPTVIL